MPLDCSCSIADFEWFYYPPKDFSIYDKPRGRRCRSCKTMIRRGDECGIFECYRPPNHWIEEDIYGDDVPMAPWYMCEECTGLYYSIVETGCCVSLEDGESMRDLAREYAELRELDK